MGTVKEEFLVERKLASVRVIELISPIQDADAIELASVGGWNVVVKKGEFQVGDLAVYFEIDSWVPHELAPFLSKGAVPKTYKGVDGSRLKSIRLRGQLSQGLLLPIKSILDYTGGQVLDGLSDDLKEGFDLTGILNVQKWERPLPANLYGAAKGNFPHFIRKTDQERVQNITKSYASAVEEGQLFEETLKLNGSSMTVYALCDREANDWRYGVCSRNIDLKLEQSGNAFVDTAKNSGLLDALAKLGCNYAIQGELVGPQIQGNYEGVLENEFFMFDVFDIDEQVYLPPVNRHDVFLKLLALDAKIRHVPVLSFSTKLPQTVQEALLRAEGKNESGREREGLVFKRIDGKFSFKVISNKYLLKGGD